MYWVSFGVDEAILGPETVVTQQYGSTRYHRTVQFYMAALCYMNFTLIVMVK